MISKLKKLIKKHGITIITYELGYKNSGTIYKWLRKGEIPRLAQFRVKEYLRTKRS